LIAPAPILGSAAGLTCFGPSSGRRDARAALLRLGRGLRASAVATVRPSAAEARAALLRLGRGLRASAIATVRPSAAEDRAALLRLGCGLGAAAVAAVGPTAAEARDGRFAASPGISTFRNWPAGPEGRPLLGPRFGLRRRAEGKFARAARLRRPIDLRLTRRLRAAGDLPPSPLVAAEGKLPSAETLGGTFTSSLPGLTGDQARRKSAGL
jgi:hypothetical protein